MTYLTALRVHFRPYCNLVVRSLRFLIPVYLTCLRGSASKLFFALCNPVTPRTKMMIRNPARRCQINFAVCTVFSGWSG